MVFWNSESFQSNPVALNFNSLNDIQMYYPKHIPMKLWFLLFARFHVCHPQFCHQIHHRQPPSTRPQNGEKLALGWCKMTPKYPVYPEIQKMAGTIWRYFLDFETHSVTKCSMFVTQRVVQTYGWEYEIYKKRGSATLLGLEDVGTTQLAQLGVCYVGKLWHPLKSS